MIINRTDAVMSGNCEVPNQLYRVRCLDASFKEQNNKGNPMTTLEMEIVGPEEITNEKGTFRLAGNKFKMYLTHNVDKIEETFAFMDKLGIEHDGDFNSAKVKDYFRGVEFDIPLSSQEQIKRFDKKPGQQFGDPMLDGEGKEISTGWQISAWPKEVPLNCRPDRVDLGQG